MPFYAISCDTLKRATTPSDSDWEQRARGTLNSDSHPAAQRGFPTRVQSWFYTLWVSSLGLSHTFRDGVAVIFPVHVDLAFYPKKLNRGMSHGKRTGQAE